MAARYLRVRIICVKVNVRKDAIICIPSPNDHIVAYELEFRTWGVSALDDEYSMSACPRILDVVRAEWFWLRRQRNGWYIYTRFVTRPNATIFG